jgi:hypothetical protein
MLTLAAMAVVACGGSEQKPAGVPPPPPEQDVNEAPDPNWDTGDKPAEADTEEPKAAPTPESSEPKEPEFKEGMSVNDAIAAVPSHYEYIGIDQEVLAKPLTNFDTYKECKVTQNDHFSLRIAVWDGKVVGADVKAQPEAKRQCIDRVVRALTYKEQVKSINTVEFSF